MYKTLNDIFIQKINEYSTADVNNRPYLTSINKKPSAEELKTIDFIATKYINSLKCNGDVTLDIITSFIVQRSLLRPTYLIYQRRKTVAKHPNNQNGSQTLAKR